MRVVCFLVLLGFAALLQIKPTEETGSLPLPVSDEISKAWELFKHYFKRDFTNAIEEGERFFIFARNFLVISKHNAAYKVGKKTYELTVNHFSDRRESELKKYHGYQPQLKQHLSAPVGSAYLSSYINVQLPEHIDWRKHGAVTPVKNQGQCGSCWAFSTTGSLEGQHFKKTGKLVSLSEQQLVDCSTKAGNMACNGGLMDNAFSYIRLNHGIDTESSYPYTAGLTGHAGMCHYRRSDTGATDTGFVDIPSTNETALKEALATVGPISIAINAARPDFMAYKEGIYNPEECAGGPMDLDHGVLLVGYGKEDDLDYWLVKNSWGPEWGEDGYIRMARNRDNLCGIATSASYPLV